MIESAMPEVQKADLAARRRTVWIVSAATVLGCVLIVQFDSARQSFEGWLVAHEETLIARPELLPLSALVLLLPVLLAALYFWRFGARVVASRRFPPPGSTVIRDTPVLAEGAAVSRGRLVQALAAMLAFSALAIPAFLWYVLWSLSRPGVF
jgi:hypothetical protein